ncbi:MAG: response regulator [Pseudomonadota bacterium]
MGLVESTANNQLSDAERKQLLVYRIVGLGSIPGVLFGYAMVTEQIQATTLLTFSFATYALLTTVFNIGSFFSTWLARHLGPLSVFTATVLAVYVGHKMQLLNLSARDVTESILLMGLVALIYGQIKLVLLWGVIGFAIMAAFALAAENPIYPVGSYLISLAMATVCVVSVKIHLLRTSTKVARSNAVMNAVFDQSNDGILYGQLQSRRVVGANTRILELFETDDPRLVADLIYSAWINAHRDDEIPPQLRNTVSKAVAEDLKFTTAKGASFYGRLTTSDLQGADDADMMLTLSDISDLHYKQLELSAAKDEAEAATAARTRFLANMSHEIRTPMNGVIGMTSLLMNTKLGREQSSYVETIRSSGEALLTIINEILDFAKIEAQQIQLEEQVFDLEQCCADALDVVSSIAGQKGLELILDMQPQLSRPVRGDVQRLRQVLVNLLSNAIKFTEQGEIRLTVQAANGQAELDNTAQRLEFAVRDTGIGIPEQKINSLFDAFVQADESTTRRFGGTGLGLSISRSLVELMGGEIGVSSREGKGSTFSFYITAQCLPNDTLDKLPDLTGRKVLAVDDNLTNQRVLNGMLDWLGVDYEMFSSPFDLLAALEHTQPELIITDMAMPDMDGVGLASAVDERLDQPPPIVLLTSLDRGDVDWNRFANVLRKPTRPTDLYFAIAHSLAGTPLLRDTRNTFSPQEDWQGESVLLAEDNLVNQKVARQMLKKFGVQVDIANNGREAIEMLSKTAYRLVFMDVQMPELDGLEATRLIRVEEDLPQPYIIAMTANAMAEDRVECEAAGMDDFVAKPVRIQDLDQALQRASASLS